MNVIIFIRNPFEIGNFSIETFYSELEIHLEKSINISIKRLPFKNKGLLPRIFNIIYCFFNQSDINHLVGDISYCALLMNKNRLILTVLDFVSLYNSKGIKFYLFKKFLFEIPIKKAREVVFISKATKEDSEKFLSVKKSSIIIPVTVNSDFYDLKYEEKEFKSNFLIIGTAPNKNISRIICALKGTKCNLEIIGRLNIYQRNKLKSFDINFFEHKNALSDNEVIKIYQKSDILIYVSVLEGFGMPIIEANLSGVCVLTSNTSSMPYVAGDAAYLVDPFDIKSIKEGILKLNTNASLRKQLIQNGFKNSKRFLIKDIANKHLKLYQ